MKVRSGQDRENVSRNTIRGGRRESRAGEAWDEIEMGNKTNFWAGKTKSYLHLPALLPEEQEWIMIVGGEWDYSEKRWGDLEERERECVNLDPVVMHVGVHQALNPLTSKLWFALQRRSRSSHLRPPFSSGNPHSLWEISEGLEFWHCGPPAPNDWSEILVQGKY